MYLQFLSFYNIEVAQVVEIIQHQNKPRDIMHIYTAGVGVLVSSFGMGSSISSHAIDPVIPRYSVFNIRRYCIIQY